MKKMFNKNCSSEKDLVQQLIREARKENPRMNKVRELIAAGVPLRRKESNAFVALIVAAAKGHTEMVQVLLENGVPVDGRDKVGNSAFSQALSQQHNAIAKILINAGVDPAEKVGLHVPISMAAFLGNKDMVEFLLTLHVPLEEKNGINDTPLTTATNAGHTEIVRLLINGGADVNALGNGGRNAIILAGRNKEIIQLLIDSGADVNATSGDGSTVLISAVKGGKLDLVKGLLAAGAEPDMQDKLGRSALKWAAKYDLLAIAQVLLNAGANPHLADKYQDTPLAVAKSVHMSKLLSGARQGRTAAKKKEKPGQQL